MTKPLKILLWIVVSGVVLFGCWITVNAQDVVSRRTSGAAVTFDAAFSNTVANPSEDCTVAVTVGAGSNPAGVAHIVWYNAGVSVVSVIGGGTWSIVAGSDTVYSNHHCVTYACPGITSANVIVTWSGPVDGGGVAVLTYHNVSQTTPCDGGVANGSSGTTQSVSVSCAVGDMVSAASGWFDGSTNTPDQGTERTESTNAGGEFITAWNISNASTSQTMSTVLGTSQNNTLTAVAVKKAP